VIVEDVRCYDATMKAIISDIHGNLEALQAVLADIERQGVRDIYCLGDLVCCGPNPCECIDLAMEWNVTLLGNFDQDLLAGSYDYGEAAAVRSMHWTQAQMEVSLSARAYKEFLAKRPHYHKEDGKLYVHGSARSPLQEWVFPEDIYVPRKLERIFALVERCCFQGHTHVPGIFIELKPGELWQFDSPDEIDFVYKLDGRKTLCNVGSVGQSRDGDWRACYVLLDGDVVHFRRVEYDVDATVRKIYNAYSIDHFLGDRLREGR
jgi:diadenosine tetraphosphatase ApaH/serine/threonine PP2A family protein phosphatase